MNMASTNKIHAAIYSFAQLISIRILMFQNIVCLCALQVVRSTLGQSSE